MRVKRSILSLLVHPIGSGVSTLHRLDTVCMLKIKVSGLQMSIRNDRWCRILVYITIHTLHVSIFFCCWTFGIFLPFVCVSHRPSMMESDPFNQKISTRLLKRDSKDLEYLRLCFPHWFPSLDSNGSINDLMRIVFLKWEITYIVRLETLNSPQTIHPQNPL